MVSLSLMGSPAGGTAMAAARRPCMYGAATVRAGKATAGQGRGVASPGSEEKTRKTAQDFEAMALGEMLQPMFDTVDNSAAPFGGGNAEKQFRSMQVLELGKEVARSGGVGIAHQVYGKMQEMQKASAPLHARVKGQRR